MAGSLGNTSSSATAVVSTGADTTSSTVGDELLAAPDESPWSSSRLAVGRAADAAASGTAFTNVSSGPAGARKGSRPAFARAGSGAGTASVLGRLGPGRAPNAPLDDIPGEVGADAVDGRGVVAGDARELPACCCRSSSASCSARSKHGSRIPLSCSFCSRSATTAPTPPRRAENVLAKHGCMRSAARVALLLMPASMLPIAFSYMSSASLGWCRASRPSAAAVIS